MTVDLQGSDLQGSDLQDNNLQDIASSTIERMKAAGFDSAQVSVSVAVQDELNITTNEASLLRSTEDYGLSITGIVDSRKAGLALTEFGDQTRINYRHSRKPTEPRI